MKRKSTMPSPLPAAPTRLRVPVLTPRNPVAVSPLLKKSTAHADKRRRAIAEDAATDMRTARQARRRQEQE